MPSNVFINKRERPDDDDVDVDIHRKTGGMFVLLKTPIVVSNTLRELINHVPLRVDTSEKGTTYRMTSWAWHTHNTCTTNAY